MKVKNRLKILRVTHGELTQQDLADKVSCSRQTIHSIESEKFVPSVELALKLARVFKVSVDEVFFLEK
jgi:putative transcriptional regulator